MASKKTPIDPLVKRSHRGLTLMMMGKPHSRASVLASGLQKSCPEMPSNCPVSVGFFFTCCQRVL